jgi:hypothetical protein
MSEAHAVRAALFNKKMRKREINFSIPGLEEYDGKLAVRSLHARDMRIIDKLSVGEDGKRDALTSQAAAICRALIINKTAERVFADNDLDFVMGNDKPDDGVGADAPQDGIDAFVLKALGDLIGDLSGMNFNAVETWKKNSLIVQSNGSSTSSTVNSELPVLA